MAVLNVVGRHTDVHLFKSISSKQIMTQTFIILINYNFATLENAKHPGN